MSNDLAKYLNSKRRHKTDVAISRQVRIAKAHGLSTGPQHRLAKVHATTCGDSNCVMCGNPRKFFGEPTQQEKRLFQDVEQTTDRHSNGLTTKENDE